MTDTMTDTHAPAVLARGWFHRRGPGDDYDVHDEASGAGKGCPDCVPCVIVRADTAPAEAQPVACPKCKGRGYFDDNLDVDDEGRGIGTIESCPECCPEASPPSAPVGVKDTHDGWPTPDLLAEAERIAANQHKDGRYFAARVLRILCHRLAQQPAAIGEEIMVNAAHDVYTLRLQPSGLSSGPRFVVHVPGPEQPAAVDGDSAEALKFLLSRIGSWTNARWDQHLRHEFGDERAERMIAALAAQQGRHPKLQETDDVQ